MRRSAFLAHVPRTTQTLLTGRAATVRRRDRVRHASLARSGSGGRAVATGGTRFARPAGP